MRRPRRYPNAVPTWFANLLPEGLLRDLIAAQRGAGNSSDLDLLLAMGEDLPGNVRVTADTTAVPAPEAQSPVPLVADPHGPSSGLIKFSLAGVQLKFSMYSNRKRTLRLAGTRDDLAVIVKTPDAVHPHACENEYTVMSWAQAAGIALPQISLEPVASLEGLPSRLGFLGEFAYVIERYDRSHGARIHQEDMCQVLDRPPTPEGKYRGSSYEEVARVLCGIADRDAVASLREYVRRLVFMVACGNGDAHLKNWSLLYPDGIHAELSPAYDLMATIVYPQYAEDKLALPLNGTQNSAAVSRRSFRGVARLAELDEAQVLAWVQEDVERTLTAWYGPVQYILKTHDLPDGFAELLQAHMGRVPLLAGQ